MTALSESSADIAVHVPPVDGIAHATPPMGPGLNLSFSRFHIIRRMSFVGPRSIRMRGARSGGSGNLVFSLLVTGLGCGVRGLPLGELEFAVPPTSQRARLAASNRL